MGEAVYGIGRGAVYIREVERQYIWERKSNHIGEVERQYRRGRVIICLQNFTTVL